MSTVIAIVLGIVVLALVFMRARGATKQPTPARKSMSRTESSGAPARVKAPSEGVDQFRGAMLFPQKDACEAVIKLRGRTFPDGRIPRIPVPGCGRDKCDCQIHQVVGRRRGPRRVATDRRDDVRFNDDRRNGKDRREGVDAWKRTID